MLGLNQRHPPCHDGALPTELIEHSLLKDGGVYTLSNLFGSRNLSYDSFLFEI